MSKDPHGADRDRNQPPARRHGGTAEENASAQKHEGDKAGNQSDQKHQPEKNG